MFDLDDWKKGDNIFEAAHHQKAVAALKMLGNTLAGAGLLQHQTPGGTVLSLKDDPQRTAMIRVVVGNTLGAGVYDGRGYAGDFNTPAQDLTSDDLGTVSNDADLYVIDLDQADIAAALAPPLSGLITFGWVVGRLNDRTTVVIPPPGIRKIRYDTTSHTIQVAYLLSPAEDQWVEMITATACP